jgi:uncharacterized protein
MEKNEFTSHSEPFYAHGVRFGCSRCSLCCRFESGFVWLSRNDLSALSTGLGISKDETVRRFCRVVDLAGFRQLSLAEQSNKDCIFWREGSCSVYEFRPLQCRSFPFWSHQLVSEESWRESGKECPGIGVGRLHDREEIERWLEARRLQPPLNADTLDG